MKHLKILSMALLVTATFVSCSKDDVVPIVINEEEVITTVTVTLTPPNNSESVILKSQDLDGPNGPDEPVVSISGNLATGTTYSGTISFLNELESPAEDITQEIKNEDEDHQIFYSAGDIGSVAYTDSDENGNPVGLDYTLTTSSEAATGNLTVILIHEPNKSADGVSAGNSANAGGETDIEVTFTGIKVQ